MTVKFKNLANIKLMRRVNLLEKEYHDQKIQSK